MAVQTAVEALNACGIETVEMEAPNADEAAKLWGDLLFTETNAVMGEVVERLGSDDFKGLVRGYTRYFEEHDVAGLIAALARRGQIQRTWSAMFDEIDLFLMPVSLSLPFENDLDFKSPDKLDEIIRAQTPLHLVNMLSLPAVALPTGLADGTPVGVQLVAPMNDDLFALDVAERLEAELGTIWQEL